MRIGRSPYPLGATWDGEGVNFALFSENATGVELCLFDRAIRTRRSHRIRMEERTNFSLAYLPAGSSSRQLYGYRVHGLTIPASGIRFNSSKVLIDPYAKGITGDVRLVRCHVRLSDRRSRGRPLVRRSE